jgi:hypothetical protein
MSDSSQNSGGGDPRLQSADERYEYLLAAAAREGAVWILRDDEGFVMVSSDQDQCIPVWPNAEFAGDWATDDWAECRPMAVSMDDWRERWTPGLEGDDILVAAFPSEHDDVVVIAPAEFARALGDAEQ